MRILHGVVGEGMGLDGGTVERFLAGVPRLERAPARLDGPNMGGWRGG